MPPCFQHVPTPMIWIVKCNDKNTDALTRAVLKVVLFVAEQLLQQKAVLLPKACKVFLQAFGVYHWGSISSLELHLEVGESNAWVIHPSDVSVFLQSLHQCTHVMLRKQMVVSCGMQVNHGQPIYWFIFQTDVYNIGLGLAIKILKQCIVQINVPHSAQKRYIYICTSTTSMWHYKMTLT